MSELGKLRMELKADLELMAIRQGDMAREVENIATGLHEGLQGTTHQVQGVAHHVQGIAQQVQGIAQQVQGIAQQVQALAGEAQVISDKTSAEVGRLSREVAAGSRWMQGRMRLLGERFEAVLGALEGEQVNDRELLYDLRDRVVRLEGKRPPAA